MLYRVCQHHLTSLSLISRAAGWGPPVLCVSMRFIGRPAPFVFRRRMAALRVHRPVCLGWLKIAAVVETVSVVRFGRCFLISSAQPIKCGFFFSPRTKESRTSCLDYLSPQQHAESGQEDSHFDLCTETITIVHVRIMYLCHILSYRIQQTMYPLSYCFFVRMWGYKKLFLLYLNKPEATEILPDKGKIKQLLLFMPASSSLFVTFSFVTILLRCPLSAVTSLHLLPCLNYKLILPRFFDTRNTKQRIAVKQKKAMLHFQKPAHNIMLNARGGASGETSGGQSKTIQI